MKLIWVRYNDNQTRTTKYILLLRLGETENSIYGLLSNSISQMEALLIKQNKNVISNLNKASIIEWLKENIPNTYRYAWREINRSNMEIDKEFNIS